MQYIGKTENKISVRWTAHRSNRKKIEFGENNDKAALLKHYLIITKKFKLINHAFPIVLRLFLLNNQTKKFWTGVKTVDFQNWMSKLI